MKQKLFTMFALLLTAATGTWAQSLYVAEITADMVAGWENDETPLPTTDLPGFKPATYEEVSAWTGAPTSGHTYLFYNHGDGGYGCFEYEDGVKSQEGSDNSERRHIYNRVTGGDKVYYTCSYDPNGPDFNLNGTLDHGTIAFTVYGNAATTAKEGQTVTVTVTADEGYALQSITGEWSTTFEAAHSRRRIPALTTIPVLGDIALTPVDGQENTWTFTMEAANATFAATLATIPYTVSLAAGTDDAGNWTITPEEAKTTGVAKGTEITATYSGTKHVKSVKAVKKAPKAAAEATAEDKGKVIGTDGNIYADVAAATAAGTTAVAKIIYIGTTGHATYSHGLALALTDEGQMAWEAAKTACNTTKNTSTPVTGATWLLASNAQWNYMKGASGAGSYTALRDGSNLQSAGYWSSTEGVSGAAWYYNFGNGSWSNGGKDSDFQVRACLAF